MPLSRRVRRNADFDPANEAWLNIIAECRRVVAARRASCQRWPTGADITRQLQKKEMDATYSRPGAPTDKYVPFVAHRIAEPRMGHRAVALIEALPCELRPIYADVSNLLRSVEECCEIKERCRGRYCSVLGDAGA